MARIKLTPRVLLTSFVLVLGVLLSMVPENTTQPYKLTANQMLAEVQYGAEMIIPDDLAHWLVNQDPSIQLIDVRTPGEYEAFHLPNAINIPFLELLSKDWNPWLDQGTRMNILYSNGTTKAHEAWMIIRQLGYENNYVLQGGLNYWAETILHPDTPSSSSPDDEIARYEFRKGASQFFGGASTTPTANTKSESKKPRIIPKKKKKKAEGGC